MRRKRGKIRNEGKMVIVYASKTGFTKKYADMLSEQTKMKAYSVREISELKKDEEILFLGWMKAGKIQGLNKAKQHDIKAVCASGTARTAEPSPEAVIQRNKIEGIPFFYLRGGCLPLKEIKGLDGFMLKMFLKMLKKRKDMDEETREAVQIIENGYDGVEGKNLEPVLEWIKSKK